ncbi:MAG: hypothetical protein JNM14_01765 [Ferruginibacter sp.]|nr:hypothetical protein [Ferruginibacter sp.]
MGFKKSHIFFIGIAAMFCLTTGCYDQGKSNIENTFYIELVNFNHDSLKQNVSDKIFGKVSFYRNDKLEILSQNYLTDDYEKMHFFKNASDLNKEIEPETKKIRLEFGGIFTRDSITYSLQKFIYRDNKWKKTSDMGFIKAVNTYIRTKQFAVDQYGKQILNELVLYSYN